MVLPAQHHRSRAATGADRRHHAASATEESSRACFRIWRSARCRRSAPHTDTAYVERRLVGDPEMVQRGTHTDAIRMHYSTSRVEAVRRKFLSLSERQPSVAVTAAQGRP
jgi:hypothetical protein